MVNILVKLSKYVITLLMAFYTFKCFSVFRHNSDKAKNRIYKEQNTIMYIIHFIAYLIIFIKSENINVILLYGAELAFFIMIIALYQGLYPKCSRLLVNNMCMLIASGMIIITRISFDKAIKQFIIVAVSSALTIAIPILMKKVRSLRNIYWFYGVIGIILLGVVAAFGASTYGANLSIDLGIISIQPSEFVKLLFVFFVASMFNKSTSFKQIVITTIFAALHVLILVLSTDLGGALIFFVTYLMMLYIASGKAYYIFAGFLAGSGAAVVAYTLFSHVKKRVAAFLDPFKLINTSGWQICQSLFAIGTGGWFGMGLYNGIPGTIPVGDKDLVFSAISEELGVLFSICIILVCLSCFIMMMNIATMCNALFYRLIGVGLGTMYIFQVFMTIGGGVKFIPLTGVTLPLVSYGGSSMLSTLIQFAVVQGLYILRNDEVTYYEQEAEAED